MHFSIASFIGLASGFGANVLMRLARRRPRLVEAVILFNADSAAAGWLEWGRGLVHAKSLAPAAAKGLGLPPAVAEWLVGNNENFAKFPCHLYCRCGTTWVEPALGGAPGWQSPTASTSSTTPTPPTCSS